jgi:hypothetical protein
VDTEKVDDSQATGECKAETKIDGLLAGTMIGGLSEGYAGVRFCQKEADQAPPTVTKALFPTVASQLSLVENILLVCFNMNSAHDLLNYMYID